MSKLEAYRVLDAVESALGTNAARVVQIGNGEYVCVLRKHTYYLWNVDNWLDYCASEGIERIYVSESRPSGSYINAARPDEIYKVAV